MRKRYIERLNTKHIGIKFYLKYTKRNTNDEKHRVSNDVNREISQD